MRLITFDKDGAATLGVRAGSEVVDLSIAAPDLPSDLPAILSKGAEALQAAAAAAKRAGSNARRPLDRLKFLPPIPRPGKMVGVGMNYFEHLAEAGIFEKPQFPGMYLRGPTSLVGHNQPMIRPKLSEQLDYEGELLFVVGRRAHHVPEAEALSYVAGYSVFNDGSVRDYCMIPLALVAGKNFDTTGGFGPEFVTADELPPGAGGLTLQTRLNGAVMQKDNTKNMFWNVAKIIEIVSGCMTLEPGDIVATGSCGGVGMMRKPPLWMKPGDVVEVEIEGIGVLRNPIVDETA